MRREIGWILVLLTFGLVGCSSTKTYTFDVAVKNDTDRPITIWLTKDGPPAEKGWRSPEQLAMSSPYFEERISGMVVPPGKSAFTGPVKGEFGPGTFAWVRIYNGKYPNFSDLLAVSRGNPKRLDEPLDPGKNSLVVRAPVGKLVVERDDTPQPPAGSGK